MKLEEYLRKNKIRHRAFAKDVDISQAHVSLIIKGERRPSVEVAKRVEKTTNGDVSAAELLGVPRFDKKVEDEMQRMKKDHLEKYSAYLDEMLYELFKDHRKEYDIRG